MSTSKRPSPKQGEVWLVDFNPPKGAEICKMRPAIVVSSNDAGKLPLRIVVPVTDWKERYADFPWFTELEPTKINGLSKPSGADGFQVKSLSCERFTQRLGQVGNNKLDDIVLTIMFCLGR